MLRHVSLLLASLLLTGIVAWGQAPTQPCGALYILPYNELFKPLTLQLPNTAPFHRLVGPHLVVERLGQSQSLVVWQGMACDLVVLPPGSEIRVSAGKPEDVPQGYEYEQFLFFEQIVWTMGSDGWFSSWRVQPRE